MNRTSIKILALLAVAGVFVIAWLLNAESEARHSGLARQNTDTKEILEEVHLSEDSMLASRVPSDETSSSDKSEFRGRVELVDDPLYFANTDHGALRLTNARNFLRPQDGSDARAPYASYTMSADGKLLGPTALLGDSLMLDRGQWAMPIPQDDVYVVDVSVGDERFVAVREPLIKAGTESATITVDRVPMTVVRAKDVISGELVDGLIVAIEPRIPDGQQVNIELSAGVVTFPPPRRQEQETEPPEPHAGIDRISGKGNPTRLPGINMPSKVWVGSDGYQWESLDVDAGIECLEVELRPVARLNIIVDAPGWKARALKLSVSRGSGTIAQWSRVDSGSVYSVDGIGSGPCRVHIEGRNLYFSRTLIERTVEILPRSTNDVSLTCEESITLASLRVELLDSDALLRVAPDATARLTRVEEGDTGARAANQVKIGDVALEGESRSMSYEHLPGGAYWFDIEPVGYRLQLYIDDGDASTHSVRVGDVSQVEVRLALPPEMSVSDLIGRPGGLYLQYRGSNASNSAHRAMLKTVIAEGSGRDLVWKFSSSHRQIDIALVVDGGKILCAERLDVVPGFNAFDLPVDMDSAVPQVHLSIRGLSLLELYQAESFCSLGSSVGGDVRLTPIVYSWSAASDASLCAKLSFLVPASWLAADIDIYTRGGAKLLYDQRDVQRSGELLGIAIEDVR